MSFRAIGKILTAPQSLRTSGAQEILGSAGPLNEKISLIVFSKDRPMQLAGLLKSIQKYALSPVDVRVLWRASQKENRQAYETAQIEFSIVDWCEERKFQEDLKDLVVKSGSYLMFATDDSLFFQPFRLDGVAGHPQVACFSMRLGLNITKCYTSNLVS